MCEEPLIFVEAFTVYLSAARVPQGSGLGRLRCIKGLVLIACRAGHMHNFAQQTTIFECDSITVPRIEEALRYLLR